eukprot:SAG31_NODE_3021_length_4780_cov_10.795770_2_plen_68_part_00
MIAALVATIYYNSYNSCVQLHKAVEGQLQKICAIDIYFVHCCLQVHRAHNTAGGRLKGVGAQMHLYG